MKSADGGGRSRPPIPERKPPVPERRPPIPAHKPPAPPRPSDAPASSATGDYSPPRAERGGISPTTAAVVTALAMSAAQPDYGQRRVSVGDIVHGVPGLRIFLRLLAWLLIITYSLAIIVDVIRWEFGGEFYLAPIALLLGWIFIANTQKRPKPAAVASPPPVTPGAEKASGGDPQPAPNTPDWNPL